MVDFIKIIKIVPLLVVIIVVYIFYRFKILKLLPREGKIIMTILLIYIVINQIIDITVEDIVSRLSMTVYITIIYIFSILAIFTRFYKKVRLDK
jgi:hypothetical protein